MPADNRSAEIWRRLHDHLDNFHELAQARIFLNSVRDADDINKDMHRAISKAVDAQINAMFETIVAPPEKSAPKKNKLPPVKTEFIEVVEAGRYEILLGKHLDKGDVPKNQWGASIFAPLEDFEIIEKKSQKLDNPNSTFNMEHKSKGISWCSLMMLVKYDANKKPYANTYVWCNDWVAALPQRDGKGRLLEVRCSACGDVVVKVAKTDKTPETEPVEKKIDLPPKKEKAK